MNNGGLGFRDVGLGDFAMEGLGLTDVYISQEMKLAKERCFHWADMQQRKTTLTLNSGLPPLPSTHILSSYTEPKED